MTTLNSSLTTRQSPRQILRAYWRTLAFRNKTAEWALYVLLVSGLPLVSWWAAAWPLQRWSLLVHALLGVFGFTLLVVPFWLSHRRLLQSSQKPLLKVTGQLLEALLLATGFTGFYLIYWGNRGDTLGAVMHWVHLGASLALAPLLMRHAFRWSVLRPLWTRLGWLRGSS